MPAAAADAAAHPTLVSSLTGSPGTWLLVCECLASCEPRSQRGVAMGERVNGQAAGQRMLALANFDG